MPSSRAPLPRQNQMFINGVPGQVRRRLEVCGPRTFRRRFQPSTPFSMRPIPSCRFARTGESASAGRVLALRSSMGRSVVLLPLMLLLGVLLGSALAFSSAGAQTLRGSQASLDRQNQQARSHGFTYLRTADQVRQFVAEGYLVAVRPNSDFELHAVSFPYTRPEVRLFLQRLASQYRSACGEKLVVTSLTRPVSSQPANASSRSVHPTGMAVDLRRSHDPGCRSWLESTLLSMERQGLVEAIHERYPPHYHVAVYPRPYAQYVARITGQERVVARAAQDDVNLELEWASHRVARGENLTSIARRYETTVARIRAENDLRGSRIMAGQTLRIPVYRSAPADAGTSDRVARAPESGAGAGPSDEAEAPGLDEGDAPSTSSDGSGTGADGGGDGAVVHRVGPGESLWSIARLYQVSENELRAANGLSGSRILAGQELRIPGASATTADRVVSYRVSPGESLWTIARRHGTSVDQIRRHNRMATTRIHAGQVLEIPVGS